jgi:hypothetical protein
MLRTRIAAVVVIALWPAAIVSAWDERGHSMITEVALDLLPDDAPAFLKDDVNRARVIYLASEPDRWRNLELPPMGHINKPEHYLDVDDLPLYGLTLETLPQYRHEYVAAMALYKAAHPEKNYGYNAAKDRDHSGEWPGMLPYRTCEMYVELKSSWCTLNTYQKYADVAGEGTLESCRQNVIHAMGIMSHYVGDAAQPLHTTKHHHGWVGDNPKGYTTEHNIHAFIDGGLIAAAHIDAATLLRLKPAKKIVDDKRLFETVIADLNASFREVEPLYELEHRGALKPGTPQFGEGTEFIERRLTSGAVMLNALWEAAYRDAGIDAYREKELKERQAQTKKPATTSAPQ